MPDNCRNIASLTMSARVKHFLSALLHALKEERHFALLDGVAFPNRRLARNRFQARTQSDPCISSVATAIMITTSNSSLSRSRTPNQLLGVLQHTIAISGLSRVRTELFHLLVIPSLAPHPIQTTRASGPWRPWRSSFLAA